MQNDKTLTLSIVIPAHNEERYLPDCLEAIASQDMPPDEVIVVDNNSSDSTARLVCRYPSVKLLSESKVGIARARNKGFNAVKGHIICRIDADTMLPTNWVSEVKKIYSQAGRPRYYVATAPSSFRNRGPKLLWYSLHRLTYFWFAKALLGHRTLFGANMFITRELWLKVRAKTCTHGGMHEDMDLAFHASAAGVRIQFLPQLKNSVLARKMLKKSFYYPIMMIRTRRSAHNSFSGISN